MTFPVLFIFITFLDFVHIHDFPCFYSFSWLFEILFILMTFPVFPDFVRSLLFEIFPVFIHFHDFLRFCSFSWLFEILFMSMTLRFVHFHDFFEILFIFMAFPFFLHFRDFLRFCSCSWDFVHVHAIVQNDRKVWAEILFSGTPQKKKKKNVHSCSFNLCCVKRCGTEGENLKERDFFKCFFLMTLPI